MTKKALFHVFGTPVTIQGWAWLPTAWGVVWAIMTWLAGKKHPEWKPTRRAAAGAVNTTILLGSEWCHNMAHAGAARLVGRPMDELMVLAGMPLCVYYDFNDEKTTPRQHISRALGGPIFNLGVMLALRLLRFFVKSESLDLAVAVNTFIGTVAFVPIPELDGGPILKWALVERGRSILEADKAVRRVNGFSGPLLLGLAAWLLRRKQWFLGGVMVELGLVSLVIARGLLKEADYTRVRNSM